MERCASRGSAVAWLMRAPARLTVAIVLVTAPWGAYAQEIKFRQLPDNDEESIASNFDVSDAVPSIVVADDFVSDGRSVTAVRWWGGRLPEPSFGPLFGSDPCGPIREPGVPDGDLALLDPIAVDMAKP